MQKNHTTLLVNKTAASYKTNEHNNQTKPRIKNTASPNQTPHNA